MKLQKHTLHLREGDMEYLKAVLPKGKASHAVRKLVSNFVDHIRRATEKDTPQNEQRNS